MKPAMLLELRQIGIHVDVHGNGLRMSLLQLDGLDVTVENLSHRDGVNRSDRWGWFRPQGNGKSE
jgi:hypothetical protein